MELQQNYELLNLINLGAFCEGVLRNLGRNFMHQSGAPPQWMIWFEGCQVHLHHWSFGSFHGTNIWLGWVSKLGSQRKEGWSWMFLCRVDKVTSVKRSKMWGNEVSVNQALIIESSGIMTCKFFPLCFDAPHQADCAFNASMQLLFHGGNTPWRNF
jgi:hypothetical protein